MFDAANFSAAPAPAPATLSHMERKYALVIATTDGTDDAVRGPGYYYFMAAETPEAKRGVFDTRAEADKYLAMAREIARYLGDPSTYPFAVKVQLAASLVDFMSPAVQLRGAAALDALRVVAWVTAEGNPASMFNRRSVDLFDRDLAMPPEHLLASEFDTLAAMNVPQLRNNPSALRSLAVYLAEMAGSPDIDTQGVVAFYRNGDEAMPTRAHEAASLLLCGLADMFRGMPSTQKKGDS